MPRKGCFLRSGGIFGGWVHPQLFELGVLGGNFRFTAHHVQATAYHSILPLVTIDLHGIVLRGNFGALKR